MNETEQKWDGLAREEFEELVFCLLNREGFMNCTWRQRQGEDEKDIVCFRFTLDGPPELFQKFVVICKHDKSSISKYRLAKDILQARDYGPFGVVFAVNTELTAYKKNLIADLEKDEENDFKVLVWEKADLVALIEQYQDLRFHCLGIAIDDLFKLPAVKNVLLRYKISDLSQNVDALLKHVYERCIRDSIAVSNAVLMTAYMEMAPELTASMAAGDGFLQRDLERFLQEIVANQPEVAFPENSIKLSDAFVKTLILGHRISKAIERPGLDETTLLYALFKISSGLTIRYLCDKFSFSAVKSMEAALFVQFDIDEQVKLRRFLENCADRIDILLEGQDSGVESDLEFDDLDFCFDRAADKTSTAAEGAPAAAPPPAQSTGEDGGQVEVFTGELIVDAGGGDAGVSYPEAGRIPAPPDGGEAAAGRPHLPYRPGRRPLPATYTFDFDILLDNWFSRMLSSLLSHHKKLTDIFIFPEKPIQIRKDGVLQEPDPPFAVCFTHFQTEAVASLLLNKSIIKGLPAPTPRQESISFLYQMKGHQSFRVTMMTHAAGVSIAFRKIYPPLWAGENLYFDHALLSTLLDLSEGIVVVAGRPGSGKTTFLNAMLNAVNQNAAATIVTMGSPIETFHAPACSSIVHLQQGVHFFDYSQAVSVAVRSGANLIAIDDLHDEKTCRACLDAARAGVAAVATICAGSCRQAFDRILELCSCQANPAAASCWARVVKRMICLTASQDPDGAPYTAFEVLDLAKALKNVEPGRYATHVQPTDPRVEEDGQGPASCRLDTVFETHVERVDCLK